MENHQTLNRTLGFQLHPLTWSGRSWTWQWMFQHLCKQERPPNRATRWPTSHPSAPESALASRTCSSNVHPCLLQGNFQRLGHGVVLAQKSQSCFDTALLCLGSGFSKTAWRTGAISSEWCPTQEERTASQNYLVGQPGLPVCAMPPRTPVQGPEEQQRGAVPDQTLLCQRELHLTLAPHFLGASFGLTESSASVLRTEVLLAFGGLLVSVAMNPARASSTG